MDKDRYFEKLGDIHLSRFIRHECDKFLDENFDSTFNELCKKDIENDHTLNATFSKLIKKCFLGLKKQISDLFCIHTLTRNPAYYVIDHFIYDFLEDFDLRYFIEEFISDRYLEKFEKLYKEGVINSDGDFIKKVKT